MNLRKHWLVTMLWPFILEAQCDSKERDGWMEKGRERELLGNVGMDVVVHTCNPSTQEAEAGRRIKFKAN